MSEIVSLRIKALLRIHNMNQNELADKAQLSKSAISKYISGTREPSGDNLIKIANALDTTTDYLLGYKEDESYTDFEKLMKLVARNLPSMSNEEKLVLIEMIIKN